MRKTPSYLKGLAETRARLASDVQRYEKLLREMGDALHLARRQLEGCDLLLKRFDDRIDPERIQPIQAFRTGKRGALKDTIAQILQQAAPEPVSTLGLTLEAAHRLGFELATPREQKQWQHNSVYAQLKAFVKEGLVERIEDVIFANEKAVYWAWKASGSASLDHLRERAQAVGAAVQQYDDDRE